MSEQGNGGGVDGQVRPKYLRVAPTAANDGPVVTMTRGELEALVSGAVQKALSSGACGPLLVDKQDLARQLRCSAAHIDHLRKRGLPTVMVGQVVRFEPQKVLAWLEARSAEGA
jgi:hypothetical protein